jgi:DNA-binding Lrp family transcriptional regulator
MEERLEYYVTFRWMTAELGLKGSELQVYALIHGFSQGEQGCYFGSLQHIADVCGFSKNTAQNALKALVDKGLLKKQKVTINNVEMCQYTARSKAIPKIGTPYQNLGGSIPKIGMGGIPKIGTNNNTPSDNKKDKGETPLSLPFSSQKFIDTWNALCEEKEWKKKTRNALQLALNKLGRYHEDFAIELIEKTIAGGWKGVVFDDTDAKYQEWKSARQQKIDNATPRTAVVNKPRQLPADNNVDAMYAKLRAKKEAEERELREQFQEKYGVTYRPSGGQDDR